MIEIYRRINGHDRLIAWCNDYYELFPYVTEDDLQQFGYHEENRTTSSCKFGDRTRYCDFLLATDSRCCYILFEDSKLVTPDRLVGMYRTYYELHRNKQPAWWRTFSWPRRSRYRGWRRPSTTNERRQIDASSQDEHAPKIRCARNHSNLIDAWDDIHRDRDRCWKSQSKRRHQWKEKK